MDIQSRTCTECGMEKPLSEFGKSKYQAKDGHTFKCKFCIRNYRRKHYAETESVRQHASEYAQKRKKENPEHVREIARASDKRHPRPPSEKRRDRCRKWYATHKEEAKAYKKEYSTRPKVIESDFKMCTKCSLSKPISEFRRNVNNRDGLQFWCKECQNAYQRMRYANSETARSKSAEYSKRWATDNPGRVKASNIKAMKKYRTAHPEVAIKYNADRRARIKGNGGSHAHSQWLELLDLYGTACLCCGRDDVPMTKDHIVPLDWGGTNDISNIQPLCLSCNDSKNNLRATDYRYNAYGIPVLV